MIGFDGLAWLVLPAGSVAWAVIVCGPIASGLLGVHDQWPVASTNATHTGVPLSLTVTVLPGSPVPENVGRVEVVPLSVGDVIVGVVGGVVFTVKLFSALGAVVGPPALDAVAEIVCGPLLRGTLGRHTHTPLAVAVAVHTVVGPSLTVTMAFGSLVPKIDSDGLFVIVPFAGAVITGTLGACVFIFTGTLVVGPVLPAASVWSTVKG